MPAGFGTSFSGRRTTPGDGRTPSPAERLPEVVLKPPLVFSEKYGFAWPGHVFPTGKYQALARRLKEAGLAKGFHSPKPAADSDLVLAHHYDYLRRLERIADGVEPWEPRFECPVNRTVVDAFRLAVGGSILAAGLALDRGHAANLSGGFHHAFADHGEGFCLLNDVVVAAHAMRRDRDVRRVLVVDLDVHQGNGTAAMAKGNPWLVTLSVHQENNYPPKERSDIDVGLPDRCGDAEYLGALQGALARAGGLHGAPDLLLYLAGADPYREDRLGGLALSLDGLAERDRIVFDWAEARGVPVAAFLAGGYARREEDVVEIHFRMVEELLRRVRG